MSALNDEVKAAALYRMKRNARPDNRSIQERTLEAHEAHARMVRMTLLDERDTLESIRMYIEHALQRKSWFARLLGRSA